MNTRYFLIGIIFLMVAFGAVTAVHAESEFGDLGDVEGIYQGLFPLILAIGLILFLIGAVYKLLGQKNPIKL